MLQKPVVYHSHDYTPRQEFQRYFDIGVFHSRQRLLPRRLRCRV